MYTTRNVVKLNSGAIKLYGRNSKRNYKNGYLPDRDRFSVYVGHYEDHICFLC